MQTNAQFYDITLTANQTVRQQTTGTMFKVVSATGPVNILTETANLKGMVAGQGMQGQQFQTLTIQDASGASNTIRILVSGDGFLDGITGTMQVTQIVPVKSGSYANTAKTVTNATGQLVAANTARTYLLVQNKDTSGTIYLNWGAGAATTANGIKIGPGGAYELAQNVSTQALQAIGDIASNTNIVVVEG